MLKLNLTNTISIMLLTASVLTGCASKNYQAPIEDRGRVGSGLKAAHMPPGHENAGKPGYYKVKPGDNLLRIALEAGQNWRDIVAWNDISNPNLIEVGQVLRVVPHSGDVLTPLSSATANSSSNLDGTSTAKTASVNLPKIESKNVDAQPSTATVVAGTTPATPEAVVNDVTPEVSKENAEPTWQWPSTGPLLGTFEEGKRKGVLLGGKAGDPVFAASDGRIVYAGNSLRGYGNLIIIKHNSQYLTAYAHNQTLLVKEDQAVRKGQKIAEMGMTETDRVQLHFEIRKQGKPIDPIKSLPPR